MSVNRKVTVPLCSSDIALGLLHPELVEERAPLRVVLVVADAARDEVRLAEVPFDNPWSLVDDVAVDLAPEFGRRLRVGGLQQAGAGDLGVDAPVTEIPEFRFRGRGGMEGRVGEKNDKKVVSRKVVGKPVVPAGLGLRP